jgi:predicted transcriptional regulator
MTIVTGDYIKRLRKERGLSQTELAKLANISQAHIAKIEKERVDPRLSTINRILSVLKKMEKKLACKDIMCKEIIFAKPNTPVKKIITIMKSAGISQLPVFDRKHQVGSVRETTLLHNIDRNLNFLIAKEVMDKPFPVVSSDDSIDILPSLLDFHPAVLVSEKGRIRGIITKSDLLGMR